MSRIDITDNYFTQKNINPSGLQFNLNRALQSNVQKNKVPEVDLQKEYEDTPEEEPFHGDYKHDPQQISLGGLDPIRDMDITRNMCPHRPTKTYAYEDMVQYNRFIGMKYTFGQNAGRTICDPVERNGIL